MKETISRLLDSYENGEMSRRTLVGALLGLLATSRQVRGSTFRGLSLNHVALRVTDVERSKTFYREHFGLPVIRESNRSCFLDLGAHFLALFQHDRAGLDHYCIAIEGYRAGEVVDRLENLGISSRRAADRVYFKDPDGIEVQVSSAHHSA